MEGSSEVVEVSFRGGAGGDPGEYAAMLKRKLDLYCAAVAKSMEAKSQESSFGNPNSQASDTSQFGSQASFDDVAPSQVITSNVIHNTDVQGKTTTNSGTSKEQSDEDDDLEENTDSVTTKWMRRMLSNRESARRSRKRKQAHLNDLEAQVSHVRAENASLLKRLSDMTQKYNDATLDNGLLRADVENLKTKVKTMGEMMKRLTGTRLLSSTVSDMLASSMPISSFVSYAASAAVPIEDDMSDFLRAPFQDYQIKSRILNGAIPVASEEMTTIPASLRRAASLEHLQRRIHGESIHSECASTFSDPQILAVGWLKSMSWELWWSKSMSSGKGSLKKWSRQWRGGRSCRTPMTTKDDVALPVVVVMEEGWNSGRSSAGP